MLGVCYLSVSMLKYLLDFHEIIKDKLLYGQIHQRQFTIQIIVDFFRPNLLLLYPVDKQV